MEWPVEAVPEVVLWALLVSVVQFPAGVGVQWAAVCGATWTRPPCQVVAARITPRFRELARTRVVVQATVAVEEAATMEGLIVAEDLIGVGTMDTIETTRTGTW